MDIFEEIWHGNLSPHEFNHIENNPYYKDAIRLVNSNQERLTKDFTREQKDLLERYTTSVDELSAQTELISNLPVFSFCTRIFVLREYRLLSRFVNRVELDNLTD